MTANKGNIAKSCKRLRKKFQRSCSNVKKYLKSINILKKLGKATSAAARGQQYVQKQLLQGLFQKQSKSGEKYSNAMRVERV